MKTCDPRTFCRARTCSDTLNDVGIAPLCLDLPSCDGVEDPDHTCSQITERAVDKAAALHQSINTEEAPLSAEELYFYCWNYFEKDQPLKFSLPPPGDVTLQRGRIYKDGHIRPACQGSPGALIDGRFNDSVTISRMVSNVAKTRATRGQCRCLPRTRAIYAELPALIVCEIIP